MRSLATTLARRRSLARSRWLPPAATSIRLSILRRASSGVDSPGDDVSTGDWEFVAQRVLGANTHAPPRLASRREPEAMLKTSGELTVHEIQEILAYEGAVDISVIALSRTCFFGDFMVFASAQSSAHLSGLALSMVQVLKRRGLGNASSADGGDSGDDWASIDCGAVVVQIMLPNFRERLGLESRWDPAMIARETNVLDVASLHDWDDPGTRRSASKTFRNYAAPKRRRIEDSDINPFDDDTAHGAL